MDGKVMCIARSIESFALHWQCDDRVLANLFLFLRTTNNTLTVPSNDEYMEEYTFFCFFHARLLLLLRISFKKLFSLARCNYCVLRYYSSHLHTNLQNSTIPNDENGYVCCVRACVNGTMHNLLFLTFSIAIDYIRWTTMWSLLNIILTIHANVSVFNAIIITKTDWKRVGETEILHADRTTWENKESELEWRTTTKNGKKEGDLHSR